MAWDYREVEIQALQTEADSGTATIDIDVTDPITEMEVAFKVQNTAAVCEDVPPDREISAIEIVDGGKVYWSTAGLEAMAVSTYEKGRWPNCWYYEGASGNQRVWIPLQFGRYLGDEEFNFNPRALLNPQLKVTWAKDTLHATGEVQLGVLCKLMQGASPAGKALMTKSVRSFTTASSGEEPTDLPTDYPYRRLFIGGELSGYSITSILSNYKLDCDVGKFIVFDLGQRKFVARCENEFGFFSYRKHDTVDNGRLIRSWFGRTMGCAMESESGGYILNGYTTSSDNVYAWCHGHDGVAANDIGGVSVVTGSFPQYIACYQFGRKDSPETWFNPAAYRKVTLKLTQATADATARILLQQPVPIP